MTKPPPTRPRTRRRDTNLTPERIIETALQICDREPDLNALTVRRLASELDVGTMTLYGYFNGKDAILDGMADHVLGRMRLPAEPDRGVEEALRTVGWAFLTMMREHPTVVTLFASRVTDSQTALSGAMEAVLQRLVDAGIPGPEAVRCYGFLSTYAMGFAGYQRPRPWGVGDGADAQEARRQRAHHYASFPSDRLPRIVDLHAEVAALPSDEQFEAGLEAWIAGTAPAFTATSNPA